MKTYLWPYFYINHYLALENRSYNLLWLCLDRIWSKEFFLYLRRLLKHFHSNNIEFLLLDNDPLFLGLTFFIKLIVTIFIKKSTAFNSVSPSIWMSSHI